MSFTYNRDIPFATNTPAHDQPLMLENTNSTYSWTGVDHFNFDSAFAGKHAQITFPLGKATPSVPVGQTEIYPQSFGSGTNYLETLCSVTPSSGPQINGYLPFVKAMAKFQFVASPVGANCPLVTANTLNFNVASVTRINSPAVGFQINFTDALPYNTYYVFAFYENLAAPSSPTAVSFAIQNLTQTDFKMITSSGQNTDIIGFMVI